MLPKTFQFHCGKSPKTSLILGQNTAKSLRFFIEKVVKKYYISHTERCRKLFDFTTESHQKFWDFSLTKSPKVCDFSPRKPPKNLRFHYGKSPKVFNFSPRKSPKSLRCFIQKIAEKFSLSLRKVAEKFRISHHEYLKTKNCGSTPSIWIRLKWIRIHSLKKKFNSVLRRVVATTRAWWPNWLRLFKAGIRLSTVLLFFTVRLLVNL